MRKAIVLMAIGILVLLPALAGCTGTPTNGEATQNPPPTLTELQQQINSLSSTISTLNGKVSNLDSTVSGLSNQQTYDDTALKQSIATLQASVDSLNARITALEANVTSSSGGSSSGDETRWSFKIYKITFDRAEFSCFNTTSNTTEVTTVYNSDSRLTVAVGGASIKESDLYDISLQVRNDSNCTVSLTNAVIELVLIPQDHVAVNEEDTYLDSDSILEGYDDWLEWDTDFRLDSRDLCKGITFTSDNFGVEITQHEWLDADLILELYYA